MTRKVAIVKNKNSRNKKKTITILLPQKTQLSDKTLCMLCSLHIHARNMWVSTAGEIYQQSSCYPRIRVLRIALSASEKQ